VNGEKEKNMFRFSRLIIPVILVILGISILLLAGCEGGKVTITIPPVTLTAPPVTLSTTITPTTTPGETTTTITPSGLVPALVTFISTEFGYKVRTMHTIIVQVTSENGTPMPGVSVEWLINRAPESVGDIVNLEGVSPLKIDNSWGIVTTDSNGQARVAITSQLEGDTYIMVYVPGINKYDNRRIYTTKHWVPNTN
jgi:hypothetical protein